MAKTKIEWCDRTWNPITGCPGPLSSPGCAHCYARRTAETRLRGRYGYDATDPFKVTYHMEKYSQPLRWRNNNYVFVNSMGDIFHPDIRVEQLDSIFAVILSCLIFDNKHDHAFMMLTKRPDIMAAYFAPGPEVLLSRWGKAGNGWLIVGDGDDMWFSEYVEACCTPHPDSAKYPNLCKDYLWPLPNFWPGITACTQDELNEKAPILRSLGTFHRFVSLEPLLEHVVLPNDFFAAVWQCRQCGWLDHGGWPSRCPSCGHTYEDKTPAAECEAWETLCPVCKHGFYNDDFDRMGCPTCGGEIGSYEGQHGVSWVICGGETGPGARPMHPDWVRSLRDQCAAFDAPFFFKGWGAWMPVAGHAQGILLRANRFEHADGVVMAQGKSKCRLLDGVEHNARPLLLDHQHRDPLPF